MSTLALPTPLFQKLRSFTKSASLYLQPGVYLEISSKLLKSCLEIIREDELFLIKLSPKHPRLCGVSILSNQELVPCPHSRRRWFSSGRDHTLATAITRNEEGLTRCNNPSRTHQSYRYVYGKPSFLGLRRLSKNKSSKVFWNNRFKKLKLLGLV